MGYIEKNAVEQKEIAKQELDEQKRRERSFMKDLKTKEVQTAAVETMDVDKTMDDAKDGGEEGMDDGNMYVIEEEIRLKNADANKEKTQSEKEKIGKDYHAMPGWNSFRT